mgnify:CR=1 FL=1
MQRGSLGAFLLGACWGFLLGSLIPNQSPSNQSQSSQPQSSDMISQECETTPIPEEVNAGGAEFTSMSIDDSGLSELGVWLDRTRQLESGGDDNAIGDKGKSRGAYQIGKVAWEAFRGEGDGEWKVGAHNPEAARRVCGRILRACKGRAVRDGRNPSFDNVRYYYTHGGF